MHSSLLYLFLLSTHLLVLPHLSPLFLPELPDLLLVLLTTATTASMTGAGDEALTSLPSPPIPLPLPDLAGGRGQQPPWQRRQMGGGGADADNNVPDQAGAGGGRWRAGAGGEAGSTAAGPQGSRIRSRRTTVRTAPTSTPSTVLPGSLLSDLDAVDRAAWLAPPC
uniref:Uncharacterized protein n=1 Tax=Oryza sativa subsp. japonica TaxID=39947 RepID=Q8H438_ORYSJ|nr:hypothetical protein [Oryza sativa Japonica Group]